jgi:hypothetical protein
MIAGKKSRKGALSPSHDANAERPSADAATVAVAKR